MRVNRVAAAAIAALGVCLSQELLAKDLYLSLGDLPGPVGQNRGRIEKYDTAGNLLAGFDTAAAARTIAVDPWGVLYATGGNSQFVTHYSPTGVPLGDFAHVGSDESHAVGLAFDTAGYLYVGVNFCCGVGFDTVERVTPDGISLGTFATVSSETTGAAFELTFDHSGRLYVTDNLVVERFDTSGQSLGIFATVPITSQYSFLVDIALDSLGNLYAMTFDDHVYAFDPTGAPLGTLLSHPDAHSLAIYDDVLYVGDADSVSRYQLDGTPLGVFIDNLPGSVLDLEFVRIVPEPNSLALVLCAVLFAVRVRGV